MTARKSHTLAFRMTFPEVSWAEQNQLASELKLFLERQGIDADNISVSKEREDTQDLGTIVMALISSAALNQFVKGAFAFAQKRASRVEIHGPHGSVVATGDATNHVDVARAAEAMTRGSAPTG